MKCGFGAAAQSAITLAGSRRLRKPAWGAALDGKSRRRCLRIKTHRCAALLVAVLRRPLLLDCASLSYLRGYSVRFKLAILDVLAKRPDGRATHDEARHDV